jgi:hypothetical protein
MKINNLISSIAMCAAVAVVAGCSKSSETPPAPESTGGTTTTAPATTVKDTAVKAVDTAKEVTSQAVTAATTAASKATAQFNDLVGKAKTFIADKKYTEALDALNKLSGVVLTPEQQKTVDDLKAQAKKLLSSGTGAVDAAKSLFGK